MAFIVPPGGFAGFSQMTAASKAALGKIGGSMGRKRRGKKRKAKAASGGKRRRSGKRKLKFGSPAWRKMYNKKK